MKNYKFFDYYDFFCEVYGSVAEVPYERRDWILDKAWEYFYRKEDLGTLKIQFEEGINFG